jgi:hypothetical protein
MRPNLKSYHATSLHFNTNLTLTDELISEIQNTSPPDKEGDSLFLDSYDGHRAWVWVIGLDKGVKEDVRRFRIEFNYEVRAGGKLGKRIPRIEQLMNMLSSTREKMNFDCRADFQFGKRLKPRPIIGLPMKYLELPDMPFDRIQGLHLVKFDSSKIKYEVILEAPANGIVMENVLFRYISEIDNSLAGKILVEAATISDKFVLKEQQSARKVS